MSAPLGTIPLAVGQKVMYEGKDATVRFRGETGFEPGLWLGLEMATPGGEGFHDGRSYVDNVRYFECPKGHGVFVRETQVTRHSVTDSSSAGSVSKPPAAAPAINRGSLQGLLLALPSVSEAKKAEEDAAAKKAEEDAAAAKKAEEDAAAAKKAEQDAAATKKAEEDAAAAKKAEEDAAAAKKTEEDAAAAKKAEQDAAAAKKAEEDAAAAKKAEKDEHSTDGVSLTVETFERAQGYIGSLYDLPTPQSAEDVVVFMMERVGDLNLLQNQVEAYEAEREETRARFMKLSTEWAATEKKMEEQEKQIIRLQQQVRQQQSPTRAALLPLNTNPEQMKPRRHQSPVAQELPRQANDESPDKNKNFNSLKHRNTNPQQRNDQGTFSFHSSSSSYAAVIRGVQERDWVPAVTDRAPNRYRLPATASPVEAGSPLRGPAVALSPARRATSARNPPSTVSAPATPPQQYVEDRGGAGGSDPGRQHSSPQRSAQSRPKPTKATRRFSL